MFLNCYTFAGRRSRGGQKSGNHSVEKKGVSGSPKIPELFQVFSSLLFHCKDQNLPRQMPTKLLLVLFCRLLRNRAVFAYLPPLGYFTTLCNIHCSFFVAHLVSILGFRTPSENWDISFSYLSSRQSASACQTECTGETHLTLSSNSQITLQKAIFICCRVQTVEVAQVFCLICCVKLAATTIKF